MMTDVCGLELMKHVSCMIFYCIMSSPANIHMQTHLCKLISDNFFLKSAEMQS